MRIDEIAQQAGTNPVPWDDVREQRVLSKITAASRERRASGSHPRRWIVAAAAAAILIAVSMLALWTIPEETAGVSPRELVLNGVSAHSSILDLSDAGHAVLTSGAKVAVEHQSPLELNMVQTAGSVRYELRGAPGRVMSIEAKGVMVRVVGTVFDVELDGDLVRVSVEHGAVRVDDGVREVSLKAGEEIAVAAVEAESNQVADLDSASVDTGEDTVVVESDGDLSEDGEASLVDDDRGEESNKVVPTAKQLLQQSDKARREGDLGRAGALLERLVREYPGDSEVVSALFTLGNVERTRGKFAQAARAYHRCWRYAPGVALAEDARAQEATSLAMAGRTEKAAKAATDYLAQYPSGTHASRMKRLVE